LSLPSESNRTKKSQSNGNRPFFAQESPIFFLIQFFSVAKLSDSDRAQNFASDKVLLLGFRASSVRERLKSDFETYKVPQATDETNEFSELL
jgi:hypothetical protein